ncbi:tachykinin-like peptides receptor 99D isoform X3 [Culex quinquefasciatus]|nr:tachykinin-like peptides receptor 99D isoform X3 [Culex quinquefasciatus]
MFLTYFLPIGSMTFTYARIGFELWGSKSIGECTQRQLENIRSKRRVVKMMVVVVVIFAVCWLPFQIYFIVTSYYPELTAKPYIQDVYLAIYWLAMSNSMYNPIIYFWMNSRFRRGFQQFFRWCPFVRLSPDFSGLRRAGAVTSRYSCSTSPDHHRIIRNDTERSILYNCSGSQRRSHATHLLGHFVNANIYNLLTATPTMDSTNQFVSCVADSTYFPTCTIPTSPPRSFNNEPDSAAGSVHIPMHLSTCQHHQATNSTFVPQKLASRNESSPAREEKRQSSTTATKNDQHQPRHANTSKGISKVQQLPL